MNALLTALTDALDEAQRTADGPVWAPVRDRWQKVLDADRRVLARHAPVDRWWGTDTVVCCGYCAGMKRWPCDDVLDLAARYPTKEVVKAMLDLGQHEWIERVAAQAGVQP